MVAEAANSKIQWLEPRDLNTQKMEFCINGMSKDLQRDACEISSCHNRVANVLLCDGTVHEVNNDTDKKVLEEMVSIA
jgi:hypothetical protein